MRKYKVPSIVVSSNFRHLYPSRQAFLKDSTRKLTMVVDNILKDGKIKFIVNKGEIIINDIKVDIANTIGIVGQGIIDVYGDDDTDTITISTPEIEAGDGIQVVLDDDKLIIRATKSGNIGTKSVDETNIGSNKILKYDGEKFVYIPLPNWLNDVNEDGSVNVEAIGVFDGGDF